MNSIPAPGLNLKLEALLADAYRPREHYDNPNCDCVSRADYLEALKLLSRLLSASQHVIRRPRSKEANVGLSLAVRVVEKAFEAQPPTHRLAS